MTVSRIPYNIEPSYNTGYAESKGLSAYPGIWDDLALALYPNMGPSIELRDFSNKRDFSNISINVYGSNLFTRSGGQWGFEHTGTGQRTTISPEIDELVDFANVTIVLGYEKTDAVNRASASFGSNALGDSAQCGVLLPWNDGTVYWDFGGKLVGAGRINAPGLSLGDDCWAFTTGNRGMEIWQNGQRVSYHATANRTRAAAAGKYIQFGGKAATGGDLALYKYFLIFNRQLSYEEIDLISKFPKAPLALSPITAFSDSLSQSVSHVLGLTDLGVGSILDKDVSHNLGLSDLAVGALDNVVTASASNVLTLIDLVVPFLAIDDRKILSDDLGLTDSVINSGNNQYVVQDLGLSDEVTYVGPIGRSLADELRLNQHVHYCFGTPWAAIEVSHELGLSHTANVPYEIDVAHVITFTDSGERIFGLSSNLGLVQIVSAGIGYELFQELGISQDMGVEVDYVRETSHTDILQDAFTFHVDDGCNRKQYTRFEGSGEADGIAEEPLTFAADFVLETLSGPKETLTLRSPETDDKHRLGFSRVNRESRGGELQVYQDPTWPTVHTLLFTLTALSDATGGCPDKINDLMDFFQNHLGEEIMIHDWEGISWKGVVVTPEEVAVEDRPRWWTISFEFQCEQLDGSQGDQTLGITDSMSHNADYVRALSDVLGLSDEVAVSGIINQSITQPLGIHDSLDDSYNESTALLDDFSGGGGTDLHGQSPDTGSSTWSAHTNYKADGSQTAINSGAYYPVAPTSGNVYYIEWDATSLAESVGLETTFFLGEGLPSDPDYTGSIAFGGNDPTTLKAGFVLRNVAATQLNATRLGDPTDGAADTVDFSDATLKAEADDIDLRLVLNTELGAGQWTATWYAKDPLDSAWTEVRAATKLIDEDITMVGWANNNTTTTVDMDRISVTKREML